MIEVDTARRNYTVGQYDPSYLMAPYALSTGFGAPHIDGQRVLVHWNQSAGNQPQTSTPVNTTGSKSDEDADDDDDEDRPFTPPPPRERLSYTRYQLELLNGIYEEVRYPNSTQKQLIAKRVGITREQVKIWFQNRRRKDVIGNTGKAKACDTSTSSTSSTGSSSKDSDQQNSPSPDNTESSSSSEENSSPKDSEESVVPSVVMKSVIGELIKFTNDPLKGKKNRKRAKAKQKEKNELKKGLASTLLAGNYDMISPPNQITPTAFFEKVKNTGRFNHSKNSSAFACPRENGKSALPVGAAGSIENPAVTVPGKTVSDIPKTIPTVTGHPYPSPVRSSVGGPLPPYTNDLPVLSDILSYKSNIDSRQKDFMSSASAQMSSALQTSPLQRGNSESAGLTSPGLMSSYATTRHLNGLYPYPFLAEQPMLLSSLRQPDHIFRPAPQYPVPHFGEDPYQPLFISSLSNPYYSPPSAAWHSHTSPPSSVYSTL